MDEDLYLGIDVGTGSARVGVFSSRGSLVISKSKDIKIHNPSPGIYEQSSVDIWACIVQIVKEATSHLDKTCIKGLSFCATCSLVAISPSGEGVTVSRTGKPEWDIIMWMDHRAQEEALLINSTGHRVLDFVGGKVSLEMQTPKLLWLKKNLPESYGRTQEFFDLPDFLRWKATGSLKRSMCSIVCKWTHLNSPDGNGWDIPFFKGIGLGDCLPKIGSDFSFPGDSSDSLSEKAKKELGLEGCKDIKVGYSLIDAHSGVQGMMGCKTEDSSKGNIDFSKRFFLICGTSNCHMALSKKACSVRGVWGPYYGVILPNLNLNEGGQSAAGKLLDCIVSSHPAYQKMMERTGNHGKVLSELESILSSMGNEDEVARLTKDLHIWPDFHGNRSPLADPTLKGMMSGLTLSDSVGDLALTYLATIQALAYGSLHIIEEMKKNGHNFDSLVICGGLAKSKLFLQSHADILNLPVLVPKCEEAVLLGAAISAAAAAAGNLPELIEKMAGSADVINPNRNLLRYHTKKYAVFLEMLNDQLKYRQIMA